MSLKKRTESSRLMRGARLQAIEYIPELRTEEHLVGCDVKTHVIRSGYQMVPAKADWREPSVNKGGNTGIRPRPFRRTGLF